MTDSAGNDDGKDRWPRRIAVLRALQLGDMLCSVPALRALRAAAPHAQITLIGLPWAREFALRYGAYIDDFLEFPGYPGLPERGCALHALPGFLAEAQLRRFGLVLQMHGSGTLTNPLAAAFGGERIAGYAEPGRWIPDAQYFLEWDQREQEVLRWLRLLAHLGIPEQGSALEFPLDAGDFAQLRAAFASAGVTDGTAPVRASYVCIHPGSRMSSRRWMPQRFAELADRLADIGLQVILTGSADEAELVAQVGSHMRAPAIDLAGKTSLGALAALVSDARMVACNDTGMSHIAAAVATPSVVVCSGADPARWAPLDRERHRLLHHMVACRPCAHAVCPVAGHPCARGISVDMVWQEAIRLLASCPPSGEALPGMRVPQRREGAQDSTRRME